MSDEFDRDDEKIVILDPDTEELGDDQTISIDEENEGSLEYYQVDTDTNEGFSY